MTFMISVLTGCERAAITSQQISDQIFISESNPIEVVNYIGFTHDLAIDCGAFSYDIVSSTFDSDLITIDESSHEIMFDFSSLSNAVEF